jgi:hypothetical protein
MYFLAHFPEIGLWYLHAACVLINPPHQLLNTSTNLDETWYVCRGTWAHTNGMLQKSLQSFRVSVGLCIPISLLGNNSVKVTNNCWMPSVSYTGDLFFSELLIYQWSFVLCRNCIIFWSTFLILKNKVRLMISPCCMSVCLYVYPSVSVRLSVYPLNFLGRLMRSPRCLYVCPPPPKFLFAVRVILKANTWLVLPRKYCYSFVIYIMLPQFPVITGCDLHKAYSIIKSWNVLRKTYGVAKMLNEWTLLCRESRSGERIRRATSCVSVPAVRAGKEGKKITYHFTEILQDYWRYNSLSNALFSADKSIYFVS